MASPGIPDHPPASPGAAWLTFGRRCREALAVTGEHFLSAYETGRPVLGTPRAFEEVLGLMRELGEDGR